MTLASFRLAFAFVAMVLLQERGCGFTPDERKGEGEPCTRTTECDVDLECRGGVCMPILEDASTRIRDASFPDDANPSDASSPTDASTSSDGAVDAALDSGS